MIPDRFHLVRIAVTTYTESRITAMGYICCQPSNPRARGSQAQWGAGRGGGMQQVAGLVISGLVGLRRHRAGSVKRNGSYTFRPWLAQWRTLREDSTRSFSLVSQSKSNVCLPCALCTVQCIYID